MNVYKQFSRTKQCRSCLATKKYVNATEAEAARIRSGTNSIYKCRFCDGWHLTISIPRGNVAL